MYMCVCVCVCACVYELQTCFYMLCSHNVGPLVRIKQGLTKLKAECVQMDLKSAVVSSFYIRTCTA